MRRVLGFLAVPALLAGVLFAGGAAAGGGGVARNQIQSAVLTITLDGYGYVHVYDITINPCDGTFEGVDDPSNVFQIDETIQGTLDGADVAFEAQYVGTSYSWSGSGPLSGFAGSDSNGTPFTLTGSVTNVANATDYKNHGDFVSSSADKNDAAHSCVGMPVVSNK